MPQGFRSELISVSFIVLFKIFQGACLKFQILFNETFVSKIWWQQLISVMKLI